MQEPIDGAVAVAAIFGGGRVKPVWFVWQGRKYAVREVTYAWEDREGAAVRKHFSVTDGTALFELCFNCRTMIWRLLKVEIEG